MKKAPNWFQVASRPKWVGGLFLALAMAAVCALLAQWQLGRSFEQAATELTQTVAKPIDSLIRPGLPVQPYSVGSLVEANVMLDLRNVYVVANRVQRNGQAGFWVVANSRTIDAAMLTVAVGFAPSREEALKAREQLEASVQAQAFLPVRGLLGSSEPPQLTRGAGSVVLESLSVGQLVNLYKGDTSATYPLFLILQEPSKVPAGLEPITVKPVPTDVQVNWLSAFYAIEWILFCGFSVFLWWRLVRDAQLLEQAQQPEKVD
ncbi:MAG: SURF1 family cytochrome oxidase biogenesis protein [Micrococcales bacterium]